SLVATNTHELPGFTSARSLYQELSTPLNKPMQTNLLQNESIQINSSQNGSVQELNEFIHGATFINSSVNLKNSSNRLQLLILFNKNSE
ncbi:14610_t:CDS:2, partial [Dentiscutata erythropus]